MATGGRDDELEDMFPGLRITPYQIRRGGTSDYNCIAWAAGEDRRWWEPDEDGIEYWPPGIPREYTVQVYIAAFESLGYTKCEDEGLEAGFEKVAVYAREGEPTHASRQLDDGTWTSKIGKLSEIVHAFEALNGDEYGSPVQILRRVRRPPGTGSMSSPS